MRFLTATDGRHTRTARRLAGELRAVEVTLMLRAAHCPVLAVR